jgi:hypothetical protein
MYLCNRLNRDFKMIIMIKLKDDKNREAQLDLLSNLETQEKLRAAEKRYLADRI